MHHQERFGGLITVGCNLSSEGITACITALAWPYYKLRDEQTISKEELRNGYILTYVLSLVVLIEGQRVEEEEVQYSGRYYYYRQR